MPGFARLVLVLPIVYVLYFHGLSSIGLLGPDEPRYASIGREMAQSGDWITPRLWGEPWFEKPALLYWMIGAGDKAGLGDDLGPRLPVALCGVLFLAAYYLLLREQWGDQVAALSAGILGASVGWIAYSRIAVPDMPMTAPFALSMLLCCEWLRTGNPRRLFWAGACLGLAVLSKGLVAPVLALPLVWAGRRRILDLWRVALPAFLVAAPWYVLCTLRNGTEFLSEFFWKHHAARFTESGLQHPQPFWYFLPVLLAGLFPWTPLLSLLRKPDQDPVRRFLWLWFLFGFVFFSASVNKLPGYLLPLMPALCALMGFSIEQSAFLKREITLVVAICAALVGLVPVLGELLPGAVSEGIGRAQAYVGLWSALPVMIVLGIGVAIVELWKGRVVAVEVVALLVAAGVASLQLRTFPALEQRASARSAWRSVAARSTEVCLDAPHRAFRYGMNYYARTPLPDCDQQPRPLRLKNQ